MESILESVKKLVNADGHEHFDDEIITHINSVFADLQQMGIGPEEGFSIVGSDKTWADFTQDSIELNSVKSYMGLRIRLLFDPPSNSAVLESMKQQIDKWEWRLNAAADN